MSALPAASSSASRTSDKVISGVRSTSRRMTRPAMLVATRIAARSQCASHSARAASIRSMAPMQRRDERGEPATDFFLQHVVGRLERRGPALLFGLAANRDRFLLGAGQNLGGLPAHPFQMVDGAVAQIVERKRPRAGGRVGTRGFNDGRHGILDLVRSLVARRGSAKSRISTDQTATLRRPRPPASSTISPRISNWHANSASSRCACSTSLNRVGPKLRSASVRAAASAGSHNVEDALGKVQAGAGQGQHQQLPRRMAQNDR